MSGVSSEELWRLRLKRRCKSVLVVKALFMFEDSVSGICRVLFHYWLQAHPEKYFPSHC